MFRRALGVAAVLLAVGGGLVAATSCASATTVSPCRQVYGNPVFSPDGTQIAYYGRRWPKPVNHANPNSVLQALCTMRPDGTNVQPLKYTVCSENCPDPPSLVAWLPSGILYLRDGGIFRVAPGTKPQKVAGARAVSLVTNPAGTRIATSLFYPGCNSCKGPVTILDGQSGAVVGTVGGKKLENVDPSLSPQGTKVAFDRNTSDNSGQSLGIWTANTNGSHLRLLVKAGTYPLWSPTAAKIAYAVYGPSDGLGVISAAGGKSRILVRRNVTDVFGWSPDGKLIAFREESGRGPGKLAVVNVATGKVRSLLQLHFFPTVAWAPDSSELVANTVTKVSKRGAPLCWATYRVPVGGSKATLISSCS